jgi:hypothetical protein
MFQGESQLKCVHFRHLSSQRLHLLEETQGEEESILRDKAGEMEADFLSFLDQAGEVDMSGDILFSQSLIRVF